MCCLVDKRAKTSVARNVTPRKTLARERAQNKIHKRYSHPFQSFVSVIFVHIIRIMTNLECLCGEHVRDNFFVAVVTSLQSADSNEQELSII